MIAFLLLGLMLGYGVPMTKIHQDCLRGDKAACEVDKKHNIAR